MEEAHYLGLIFKKKDLIKFCTNNTDFKKEKYSCEFSLALYNKHSDATEN